MNEDCVIYKIAGFIGKKWTIPIILELYKKKPKKRYSEIKKNFSGITPKILSMRLKELEKNGLVKKEMDISSVPVKCYYSLTERGLDFIRVINQIKKWGLKWNYGRCSSNAKSCKNCDL
ncbi:transcriptional regulator [Candidatus Woesearchaeota archaeon]|nr:MAG: transcriptional regulator [Candidatus Woesearchaeota archaeon]